MSRIEHPGHGFCVFEYDDGRYEINFDTGHFTPEFSSFPITKEEAERAFLSDQDAGAVMNAA